MFSRRRGLGLYTCTHVYMLHVLVHVTYACVLVILRLATRQDAAVARSEAQTLIALITPHSPLRHRGRLACTRSLERRTAGCVLFVTCYLLPTQLRTCTNRSWAADTSAQPQAGGAGPLHRYGRLTGLARRRAAIAPLHRSASFWPAGPASKSAPALESHKAAATERLSTLPLG